MGKMRRGCAKCRQVRPLLGAPPQVPGSRAGQEGPCSGYGRHTGSEEQLPEARINNLVGVERSWLFPLLLALKPQIKLQKTVKETRDYFKVLATV